jgi:hypothetical protein
MLTIFSESPTRHNLYMDVLRDPWYVAPPCANQKQHILTVIGVCCYQLRRLRQICRPVSQDATARLVLAITI